VGKDTEIARERLFALGRRERERHTHIQNLFSGRNSKRKILFGFWVGLRENIPGQLVELLGRW
jgi:hypothetical protein